MLRSLVGSEMCIRDRLLLLSRLHTILEPRAPVNMKGKGAMEVWVIGHAVGLNHLPQASVVEFTQELNTSVKFENSDNPLQSGCANRSAVVQWQRRYDDAFRDRTSLYHSHDVIS
eukprot:TRINITY_DN3937_c0_g2_i1.p1 TRINITY_DN3937_c0_g2~~TRINITY_DN3937_c0_g2_i1.p1  ORF type:complete len:115 (-),score=18.37 TRINITY_DN3937_c0_g2_i1:120-464(-)